MDVKTATAQLIEAIREEERERVLAVFGKGNGKVGAKRKGPKAKRNVPATCVAPNCGEPHKGPRFHFLGEKHLGASKADYTKWIKAWREKNG